MKIKLFTPKLIIGKPTYICEPKWIDSKQIYSYDLLTINDIRLSQLFKEMLKIYKHETNLYATDISWIMAKLYDQILRYSGEEPIKDFLGEVGVMLAALYWAEGICKERNVEVICYT